MIDANELARQNQLAKKLVEQRIAANVEDAMAMLSNHRKDLHIKENVIITPNEDTTMRTEQTQMNSGASQLTGDAASKITELENKLNRMNELLGKLRDTMNANFKEVDQRLNEAKQLRMNAGTASAAASGTPNRMERDMQKQMNKPHPKCDPDNYKDKEVCVENIFSNAHGKMMKRR
jgi:hypothetical protein